MEILIGVLIDCFGVEAGFDFKKRVGAIIREVEAADTSSRRRIAELLACTSKGIAFFSETCDRRGC